MLGIFISFAKKIFIFGSFWVYIAVFLSFLINIAKMLAFFLPIKAVILASTGQDFIWYGDSQYLFIVLALLAIIAYGIHFLAINLFRVIAAQQSHILLRKANKFLNFSDSDIIGVQFYDRMCSAISNIVFIVIIIILGLIYVKNYMALYLATFTVVASGGCLIYRCKSDIRYINTKQVENLSNAAFFIYFIVILFLLKNSGSVILSVLALISTRIVGQSMYSFYCSLEYIKNNAATIRSLFYSNSNSIGHEMSKVTDERQKVVTTITEYLFSGINKANIQFNHFQTGYKGISVFTACYSKRYTIKFSYATNKSFAQERELLKSEWSVNLPALKLIDTYVSDQTYALIFKDSVERIQCQDEHTELQNLLLQLWKISIPESIIEKYTRSHGTVYQQIEDSMLATLYEVATIDEHKRLLRWLIDNCTQINALMYKVPLVIANPKLNWSNMYRSNHTNNVVSLNWESWQIACVGSCIPKPILNSISDNNIREISKVRSEFSDISVTTLHIVASIGLIKEHLNSDSFEYIFKEISILKNIMNSNNTSTS